MDKRLVIYEHWLYEEEEDTWFNRLEQDVIVGTEVQLLIKMQDFLESNCNLEEDYYVLTSITKIPFMEI